jgi:type 1 glutamine amidotransferase
MMGRSGVRKMAKERAGPGAWLALLLLAAALGLTAAPTARTIRVLILSGQNNHDWRQTTPRLKALLEQTGRFEVDVTEKPGLLTAPLLEPYDVILSNWNSFGLGPEGESWPEDAKRAYLDFVRRGKGHLVVHAGSASFPEWKEYGELALATWKKDQTVHGPRHEFTVRMESQSHPVTAGLKPFKIFDELWNRPGIAEGATVLASSYSAADKEGTGRWEPTALAGSFGAGRSFALLLGHDAEAMDNPGFRTLLRRGVEWAATGRVEPSPETAARPWRVEEEKDASLALVGPAGPLWRFRYGQTLDTPYFHPLNTADGRTLTWDRPPDHVWHHGLWFSWKFINKVNYWEIDAKTGRPAGRTSWENVKVSTGSRGKARITLDLAYRPAGEALPVLTERRTIDVGPPDPDGIYLVDWEAVFTAAETAVLDRTPLPGEPDGQVWGGYSGLSIRLAGNLDARQAVTSDGPVINMPDDRYRGLHAAVDYSGLLDGRPVGVAISDHSKNPRHPTPWYIIRSAEMSFFSPAVICYAPLTLSRGESLTLRYRVLVHSGRWDAARLKKEFLRFSRESK